MYSEDEPQLPEIPEVFETGRVGPDAIYETDTTLPQISGLFERGIVSRDVPLGPEPYTQGILEQDSINDYSTNPYMHAYGLLPNIPEYFEGGTISNNVLQAEYQNLPAISEFFEQGRLAPPYHQTSINHSPQQSFGNLEISSSSQRSALDNWPWNVSDFSAQRLQSPSEGNRFGGFFSPSLTTDPQLQESNINLSSIRAPDDSRDSFFQQLPGQTLDSGLGHNLWSDFSPSGSGSAGNLDWIQNILSQTRPSTEQGLWSDQYSTARQDTSTQLLQPSSNLEDWTKNIFEQSFSTSVPQFERPESNFQPSQVDIYANSGSIAEDIALMATKGFVVESNSRSQFTGALLQGWFGPEIRNQTDIMGRPYHEFEVGQRFIIKFIEFDVRDPMSDTKREMFDIERFILTYAQHPNIVSIRGAFNMGQHKQCKYRHNPYSTFTSWDRQYIILEFADLGDLENYLEDNILSEQLCISFILQLYSGLKQLHDSYIFHCDIEPRNILLFGTNGSDIIVKWCDFSIGCILNGTHPSQASPVQNERIIECSRYDLECLAKIYQQILYFSTPTDQCSQSVQQIIDLLRSATNLNEINSMVAILSSK